MLPKSLTSTDSADKKIGDTVAEQKAFGVAYAKAILDYFGITYKTSTVKTETDKNSMYRVQVGAFTNKSGAEAMISKLKCAGFSGFIVKE